MFKRFCSAVSKSNGNYVFDAKTNADEQTLVGKKIGLVFGEEEYYSNSGEKKTRLYVAREYTLEDITAGKFKVPETKKLKEEDNSFVAPPATDDIPF